MEESAIPTTKPIDNQVIENPVSVKESHIRKLINDLYIAYIKVPATESASSSSTEPQILSIFNQGYQKGFHKKNNNFDLDLQNYINFIIDQIIHAGITFEKNDAYESAIILLTKLIAGISIKLNIHINEILGVIVLGHGHGGKLTITLEENTLLNESVNIIEFVPVVAEETNGFIFTFDAAKAFAIKQYENSGKSLSREDKEFYREYCGENFKIFAEDTRKLSNNRKRVREEMASHNNMVEEEKKYAFHELYQKPIVQRYSEFDLQGKKIDNIFKELDQNPNAHIDEYYKALDNKLAKDIEELDKLVRIAETSLNTNKMFKSHKSKTNKIKMCEKIQLLSTEPYDNINANMYTMFYVLPSFAESHSTYTHIIQCMMNRIFSEFQIRRKSLVARAENTRPITIFKQLSNRFEQFKEEIPENTEIFYDFAFLKDQKKIEPNKDGFSFLFMFCLDKIINRKIIDLNKEKIFKGNQYGTIFINPAIFMSVIGKIFPNIKITYIHNSCRETITDNTEFIMSSSENTPIPTPIPSPRKTEKRAHSESPSASPSKTRKVETSIEQNQINSSTPGGSRRRKFRRSTRHKRNKRTTKKYHQYSIGNGRRAK